MNVAQPCGCQECRRHPTVHARWWNALDDREMWLVATDGTDRLLAVAPLGMHAVGEEVRAADRPRAGAL